MIGRRPLRWQLALISGARLGAFFYWTRFFENNVPFDNILLQFTWSVCSGNWVRIRVRLKSCTILAFFTENKENEHLFSANVTDRNLLLKERTHTINNKIQLHILGVPPNKLDNWLIAKNVYSNAESVSLLVVRPGVLELSVNRTSTPQPDTWRFQAAVEDSSVFVNVGLWILSPCLSMWHIS